MQYEYRFWGGAASEATAALNTLAQEGWELDQMSAYPDPGRSHTQPWEKCSVLVLALRRPRQEP